MAPSRPTVFFDFIDPLSYLLSLEIEQSGTPGVDWLPLELRPPPTPLIDIDDPSLADRWRDARAIAADLGVELSPPRLVPWTRKAHELVLFSSEHDRGDALRRRLFDAYMLEGRDIGRVDVLIEAATGLDLPRTETKAVLDVDRYEAEVASIRDAALGNDVIDPPTILSGTLRLEGFHNRQMLGTLLGT
ncbi:MAG: DsbA family protein [Gemmatimonadota bacterium]|nr:DsbA family protein [Gemmatimonadota bacterium]MDH3423414.1 DsbA family protein [Gemmatimonadota bacterium]